MQRGACVVVILAYLAVGGLGFVEVSCLCHERDACILPLTEACTVQPKTCDDREDGDRSSVADRDCPCGPCVDLLIASSLLLDLPASEAGPVTVDAPGVDPLAPASCTVAWSTPAGPSPPAPRTLSVLRC